MLELTNLCRTLQLEYIDLYLIHWPITVKPGKGEWPFAEEDMIPMDFKSVWAAMEECQRLGLAKFIGVSNFSCKKLQNLLSSSTIPPVVNQVSPVQQLQLFILTNDILLLKKMIIICVGGDEPCLATKETKRFLQGKWNCCHCFLSFGSKRD